MKVGDVIWEAQDIDDLMNCWDNDDWFIRDVRVIRIEKNIITVEVVDAPDTVSYIPPSEIFPSRNAALAWMVKQANDSYEDAKAEFDKTIIMLKRVSEECVRGLKLRGGKQ